MLASILFIIGAVLGLVGGIWLLVVAVRTSILWGLGSLFIPKVDVVLVTSTVTASTGAFL